MTEPFADSHCTDMEKDGSAPFPGVRKRVSRRRSEGTLMLLALFIVFIASCNKSTSPPPASNDYTAFGSPQLVTISSYTYDAMEPFISRDGNCLFFNDNTVGPPEKDLHYASFVTGTTFQYKGAITAINSIAVDGVPTTDSAKNFYFVSLANYDGATNLNTLYVGQWNGSTVTNVVSLPSLTLSSPLLFFDIEVNPAGTTLYLSVGAFTGGAFPSAADIHIAVDSGGGFVLDTNSPAIMANVNTTEKLEYAPAISDDGLELFFTRFDPGTGQARIYRAVRSDTGSAFGTPQLVSAITGFVEGPAFSPDEKSLYYHRLNTSNDRFEIYRVTRP